MQLVRSNVDPSTGFNCRRLEDARRLLLRSHHEYINPTQPMRSPEGLTNRSTRRQADEKSLHGDGKFTGRTHSMLAIDPITLSESHFVLWFEPEASLPTKACVKSWRI